MKDYVDRTEAQQRGALHAHLLEWYRRRPPFRDHMAIEPKQRPVYSKGEVASPYKEDEVYYKFFMARVNSELVRPMLRCTGDADAPWGGFVFAKLVIAGLARAVQVRLNYILQIL